MKTTLLLLLASGLPLAACAANQSVDLELALGAADPTRVRWGRPSSD